MSGLNVILIILFIKVQNACCITRMSLLPPPSPCPDVFRYERVGPDTHGMDYNIRGVITVTPVFPLVLKLKMQLPIALTQRYPARLLLNDDVSAVLEKYKSRTLRKMSYHVVFPRGYPFPEITLIEMNGQVLCSSYPSPRAVKTDVTLERSFRVVTTPREPQDYGDNYNDYYSNGGELQKEFPDDILRSGEYPGPQSHHPHSFSYHSNPFHGPPVSATGDPKRHDPTTPRDQTLSGACGKPIRKNQLIVGGSPLSRGDLPWMVPLFTRDPLRFFCTSVLISDLFLITAAHCVRYRSRPLLDKRELIAKIGCFDVSDKFEDGIQSRNIDKIITHPDYHPDKAGSDLALLRLDLRVTFTQYVRPICLWSGSDDLDEIIGLRAVVAGWGTDGFDLQHTATPHSVSVPIVSQTDCIISRRDFLHFITDKTLCAGSRNGVGPCNGDSGGGLMLRRKARDGSERWFLRGIVSLSLTDDSNPRYMCNLNEYIIYTDVAKMRSWLLQYV